MSETPQLYRGEVLPAKRKYWDEFERNLGKLVEVHTFDGKVYRGFLSSYEEKHGNIYLERVKEKREIDGEERFEVVEGVGIAFRGHNVTRIIFLER